VDLSGLAAVLAVRYDDDEPGSPWDFVIYLDERADEPQHEALESVFTGRLGGTAMQHFPWAWKPSRLRGVRRVRIDIDHVARRSWFRAGEHVSVRVREPVGDQEPVTCVIPGHNRTGTEYVADLLHVSDGPLDFSFDGRCAFQSTFEYRGPE